LEKVLPKVAPEESGWKPWTFTFRPISLTGKARYSQECLPPVVFWRGVIVRAGWLISAGDFSPSGQPTSRGSL